MKASALVLAALATVACHVGTGLRSEGANRLAAAPADLLLQPDAFWQVESSYDPHGYAPPDGRLTVKRSSTSR
jgi:hypothetical protein